MLQPTKSFLHRPQPVLPQESISPLAHRSHSIGDVLKAVERGQGNLVGPEAYLPELFSGDNEFGSFRASHQQQLSQEELFRRSSFVQNTSSYDAEVAALERKRELDAKVVLFPKELRGENRFFTSPEMGFKAIAMVEDSRRPSSLFSHSISSSCREELNTIHRVKHFEDIKIRGTVRPPPSPTARRRHTPPRHAASPSSSQPRGEVVRRRKSTSSPFRPLPTSPGKRNDGNEGSDNSSDQSSDIVEDPRLPQLSGISSPIGAKGVVANSRRRGGPGAKTTAREAAAHAAARASVSHMAAMTTAPRFLVHVDDEDREMLPGRNRLGRRIEYGRMVGMFREELLASRPLTSSEKWKSSIKHHDEVLGREGQPAEVLIDWSHCDLYDALQLMDVIPRNGVCLLSTEEGGGLLGGVVGTPTKSSSNGTVRREVIKSSPSLGVAPGSRGAPSKSASTPEPSTRPRAASSSVAAVGTPSDARRPTTTTGAVAQDAQQASPHHGGGATMTTTTTTNTVARANSVTAPRKSVVVVGGAAANSPPQPSRAAEAAGAGRRRTTVTVEGGLGRPAPAPAPKVSRVWDLKYCFNDDDAADVGIEVSRGLTVVESGGQKYAFDATRPKFRDLDSADAAAAAAAADAATAAKRERQRWLRMSPDEREARRVHKFLSCGRAFEGRHVSMANNYLTRVDMMLTNTLFAVMRTNVTKLDLSFNRIEVIDASFLTTNPAEVAERKRVTLATAAEQEDEEMRLMALSHSGLLSDAQQRRQLEQFLAMRRRAVADLIDPYAANKLFYNLQSLYLHGNPLRDISELWKLEPLRRSLMFLTFHGQHHVDAQARDPRNRLKLLNMFPNLVQLNFTALLPSDEELRSEAVARGPSR